MAKEFSKEWWRWRINRRLADYMDGPDEVRQKELDALLNEYRRFHELRYRPDGRDEHEWALDWR